MNVVKNGEAFTNKLAISLNSLKDFSKDISKENISYFNSLEIINAYKNLSNLSYKIKIENTSIRFKDSIWDFSQLKREGVNYSYKFHFTHNKGKEKFKSEEYEILLRLFLIWLIKEKGLHSKSVSQTFFAVKRFLLWLEFTNIYSAENIDVKIIKKYEDSMNNLTQKTIVENKRNINLFLECYYQFTNTPFPRELKKVIIKRNKAEIDAEELRGKTPLIPQEVYKNYCSLLLKSLSSNKYSKNDKGLIGLLYLDSQLGLRPGEIIMLNSDSLDRTYLEKFGGCLLKYRSKKNGDGKNHLYTYNTIAINDSSVLVFEKLVKLFNKDRIKLKTQKLVPNKNSITFEYTTQKLQTFNICFCLEHAKELNLINRSDRDSFLTHISNRNLTEGYISNFKKLKLHKEDEVSIPAPKQFRVYVATELYFKGVSEKIISQMYGHKTLKMIGYYVRPHAVQENIDSSKEIFETIISEDLKILGPKGDYYKEKINNFIKENNYNCTNDLTTAVNNLCNEIPIKMKLGGFCMKSNPSRECRHDSNTDEIFCAYGCCPNHCHFYFSAPITYQKCLDIVLSIRHDLKNNYEIYAQKESYKLKAVINNELIPEINELKRTIKEKGVKYVVLKHDNLNDFIKNIKEIEKEIKKWTTMTTNVKH